MPNIAQTEHKCAICKKTSAKVYTVAYYKGELYYCEHCFGTLVSNPPRGVFAWLFRLVHGGLRRTVEREEQRK